MTFKRLLGYLKPYKKQLYLVIIMTTLSSICTILSPKIIGAFISSISQSITNNQNLNTRYLVILLTVLSIFYLINIFSSLIENYYMNNISEKALNKLKIEANEKLSKLNQKYYDTHKKGDLITRINNDTEIISSLFSQIIPRTINYIITFFGVLIIMLTINIELTLIILISLPLTIYLSKLIIKLSKKKYQQYYQKNSNLNIIIEESYHNQEIISLYNNDTNLSNTFTSLNKDLAKTNMKATLITNLLNPISQIISYSVYIVTIILSSSYVLKGKLLLGDIYSFIQYTKQLSSPINSFSSLIASVQNSLVAASRIFEILDEQEEIHEGKLTLKNIEKIEFKNVNFSYNNTPTITNFNLTINKGEKIAIIGETGCGKSTIINLLLQFYKINSGEILINDKSIYDYDLESYYSNISLVPQEIYLFNDTIENNLKFANLKAKQDDIIKACKTTKSLEFINKLPNKLQEIIKEEKSILSQGEKQLLTITRSIIKEHNLLILDEATSNIDSKNEKHIQEFIENLPNNKTVLMIAHKLSTITKADKIIVLKQGKITEIGNHKSLYKEKGEYYNYLQSL